MFKCLSLAYHRELQSCYPAGSSWVLRSVVLLWSGGLNKQRREMEQLFGNKLCYVFFSNEPFLCRLLKIHT